MFASNRAGYILGGAILGIMATKFGIKSAIVIQLPLLVLIMALPLFLRERPGDKLFPWSATRSPSLWNTNEQELDEGDDESSDDSELELPWTENEADDPYRAAHWTAKNLISRKISLTAAVLWVSIGLILLGMVVYIGGVLIEEDWRERPILFMDLVDLGAVSLSIIILLQLFQKLGIRLPVVPNPFARVLTGPAVTSYNIVKGFSLRSSFLLIFLCLLSELYLFVDPIILDIFINEAGWEMDKYSAVMGGVVIAFLMAGQLIGGFLGDRFGVREVAMIGFTLLALANAGLAVLQGYWENTTIMVAYLCLRAIINGLAWISIISVSMRLTYSKAGGTQFTAYMSMFNLSGVIALSLTGKAIEIMDYISALYLGAALTLLTVIFLVFIDPDECDRVLEGRLGDDKDEDYGGDLGEASEVWWEEGEPDVVSA